MQLHGASCFAQCARISALWSYIMRGDDIYSELGLIKNGYLIHSHDQIHDRSRCRGEPLEVRFNRLDSRPSFKVSVVDIPVAKEHTLSIIGLN